MNDNDNTRAKVLGGLLREARMVAGRSIADCAQVLAISPEMLAQAEEGTHVISLPQLEVLAIYLKVPMAYFWGSQELDAAPEPDYQMLLALRHRMLGVQLQQARVAANMTIEDLAAKCDLPAEILLRFEHTPEEISLLALESISKALEVPLDDFVYDAKGPLARHEMAQKQRRNFDELPPEVKDFVTQPVNLAYLETAMRLSEMDVPRLRQIAEGLLDITL